MKIHLLLSLLFALSVAFPVQAAPTSRFETPEAQLRLVATLPDEQGVLRGALVIDLKPGWKTYWLSPGEAGLAPELDFTASQGLADAPALSFPIPHYLDDGFSISTVYAEPMAIAFTAKATDDRPVLDLTLTIGVCQTICIPLQARLVRDLHEQPALGEIAAVRAAFTALPDEAAEPLKAEITDDTLVLSLDEAELPDTEAQLFISGPAGWAFGPPSAAVRGGDLQLTAPVETCPQNSQIRTPASADILIVAGEFARFWRANPVRLGESAACRGEE